jgi:hypothetical protein
MSTAENARAQQEARASQVSRSSADRARFWASLNRYLAAEAEHQQHDAEQDVVPEPEKKPGERGTNGHAAAGGH